MSRATLIVLAKVPVPGRSKTRLCPPCTPEEAALLAGAALADTLDAVHTARAPRRVLALDGEPGEWLPDGFEVMAQRDGGLAERLAGAFDDTGGPALLVGMDTPQLDPIEIEAALTALEAPSVDAVLGGVHDGGYWAIGLRDADARVFEAVPMSTAGTGAAQRRRMAALGLRWTELPVLRDVDTIADARAVAAIAPRSRFAAALAGIARDAETTRACA